MKQIRISDVTMKQKTGEIALSFKEKIELAKLLDKLGVTVIELEGIQNARIDSLRIKSIAMAVRESVVADKKEEAPVAAPAAGMGGMGGGMY